MIPIAPIALSNGFRGKASHSSESEREKQTNLSFVASYKNISENAVTLVKRERKPISVYFPRTEITLRNTTLKTPV